MATAIAYGASQSPDQIAQMMRHFQTALCNVLLPTANNPHANIGIAGTTTKVRTGSGIHGVINGVLFKLAATDNVWTLAGTVTNAKFNVFVVTLNAAGVATAYMGTEGATLAAVVFPVISPNELVIGVVTINPTGTGNFVGGTTALTDATVVPNAAYINATAAFSPNAFNLPVI